MAIARPSSDFSVGAWQNQSGGTTNLYASIDETIAALNLTDYVTVLSAPLSGDPDFPYTAGLSAAPTLNSGDQFMMSCYAGASYVSGLARSLTWELLDGATVKASTTLSVTNSVTIARFVVLVSAAVTALTTPRYRWTLMHDGTDWSAAVYQAELGSVFAHLDIGTAGFEYQVVAPASGHFLALDTDGSIIKQDGYETSSALILGPTGAAQVHG